MRFVGKILFYGLSLVFWVVVLVASLELYGMYRQRAIANANPYVLATTTDATWPIPEKPLALEQERFPSEDEIAAVQNAFCGQEAALLTRNDPSFAKVVSVYDEASDFLVEEQRFAAWLVLREIPEAYRQFWVLGREAQVTFGNGTDEQYYAHPKAWPAVNYFYDPAWDPGTNDSPSTVAARTVYAVRKQAEETGAPAAQRLIVQNTLAGDAVLQVGALPEANGNPAVRILESHPLIFFEQATFPNFDSTVWDIPWLKHQPFAKIGDEETLNAFGLRGDPIALPKPERTFRAICIGGSTTFEGTSADTSYPSQLERMLNERVDGIEVDVINAGTSGATASSHVARLHEYLSMDLDLVVLYCGVNDTTLLRGYHPEDEWQRKLWQWGQASSFVRTVGMDWLAPSSEWYANEFDTYAAPFLDLLIRTFQSRGVPVVVSTIAAPELSALSAEEEDFYDYSLREYQRLGHVSYATYYRALQYTNQRLGELAAEHDAPLIPMHTFLNGGTRQFVDNCHAHPRAIEYKAALFAEYLMPVVQAFQERLGTRQAGISR